MGSNYKRLGDYIHKVERRNRDSKVTKLRGLSMTKEFRETTSNTVGTDMSVYKVMTKWQFACDFMSVIRVHKFPVVLKTDDEPNLVSPAYPVFGVKDSKELHPEYLMMWFRRSEFDRYADFKCDSAIRGGFDWDALCDCMLPIPSPEKQLEIVKEYNTIQNRIILNNQLITKLEETAQAIYKQWFVDFEFPDQNGKPYKSNGGEMVFCEELEKEIPVGWEMKPFTSVVKLSGGGTPSTEEIEYWNGSIPFYTPGDLVQNYFTIYTSKHITALGLQKCSSKLYQRNTTFVTARGATVGGVSLAGEPMAMNQTCYAIISNDSCSFFAHQLTLQTIQKLKKEATGATFEALVTKDFDGFLVLQPDNFSMISFEKIITNLYQSMLIKSKLNQKLEELKFLLLARMTKV
jgi:type I restriction enzyme S subunit